MNIVDLHVHSTKSDGSMTPAQLVDYAVKKGLTAFALTDHDTTDGIEEAIAEARKHNQAVKNGQKEGLPLEIIPGVEFSTEYQGKDIHILGLYIDHTSPAFKEKIQKFVDSRILRNKKMCESLSSEGIDITYEKLIAENSNAIITRSHYAKYLLNHGYTTSMKEAFDRYIGDHAKHFIPREKISPIQAVDLIHEAGGLAFLAHPTLYHMSDRNLESLIMQLKNAGLDGIEAVYSTYTQGEELQMRKYASKYNLLISGGSDFHGSIKPKLDLAVGYGKLFIPASILEDIKAYRKNKTKIFFADLDGTLLNDEKKITPLTYETLKAWTQKGHKLVLCSGRAMDSILHVRETLGLGDFPNMYLIGYNGGEIYDCTSKTLLHRVALSYDSVRKCFEIARQYHIHIQTFTDTHILTQKEDEELRFYKKAVHTPVILTDDIMAHLEKEPCKCLAISLKDKELMKNFSDAVTKELGDQVHVMTSTPYFIEMFPISSGKGFSVNWLCSHLNIPLESALAAGDEMNDLSMLEAAGISIAMKNGRDFVKEMADVVTANDNNHDGLVPILQKYI